MDGMYSVWKKTFAYMFEDMEGIQGRENHVFNTWCLNNQRSITVRGGESTGVMREIMCMMNILSIGYEDVNMRCLCENIQFYWLNISVIYQENY